MLKNSILPLVFVSMLFACKHENPDVVNAQPVGDKVLIEAESGKKTDELKANSAQGGDPKGMMSKALQTLQESFKSAKDKVPGVGDVTVLLDDNYNLLIENKSGFSTTTTQVNLKSLDTNYKNIEILSDAQGHEHPGFRIKTLAGQPKVVILKGASKEEKDYLEIILAERPDVQHSLAALTMAAQVAQNTLPIGEDK